MDLKRATQESGIITPFSRFMCEKEKKWFQLRNDKTPRNFQENWFNVLSGQTYNISCKISRNLQNLKKEKKIVSMHIEKSLTPM